MEAIQGENIDCAVHYPIPLTKQPIIMETLNPPPYPVSERVSKQIFSLPMHPALTDQDLKYIVAGVERVTSRYSR